MPRNARIKSISGIYHIIMRGANRQEIFHDEQDCLKYLGLLKKYKDLKEIKIFSWCLMNNHVHLLLKEGTEELAVSMKRIGVSYVYYYNAKYNTSGHLFQDRFRSEEVETNRYFLTVARYIHQNPLKAGIVKSIADWEWSSYKEYFNSDKLKLKLTDTAFLLHMFSVDMGDALTKFKEFSETYNNDKCLDNRSEKLSDEEARIIIQKVISEKMIIDINIAQIKSMSKEQRNTIIKNLKAIKGITQKQLSRITGISQTIISIS